MIQMILTMSEFTFTYSAPVSRIIHYPSCLTQGCWLSMFEGKGEDVNVKVAELLPCFC